MYDMLEKLITDFGEWKLPQLPTLFEEWELQPTHGPECVTTLEGCIEQASTNFYLTRVTCILARPKASSTNRGSNYTIQQVVDDDLIPMEIAPSGSSASMRHCLRALTGNTGLTRDCAGVRLCTSADYNWTP